MLKRVSIQNFKSLKDVTLDLQKVNLLIGPNNSGKTNFLKALEFISRWSTGNTPINSDFSLYSFRTNSNPIIETIIIKINTESVNFSLDITPRNWLSYKEILEQNGSVFSELNYDYLFGGMKNGYSISQKEVAPTHFEKQSIQEEYRIEILYKLINRCPVYKPEPNKLDKPAPVGRGDSTVAADASNLIAFFDRIRDEYPATFAQIKADLAKCVPEFTEINFQNVESTDELVKQFGDKTFKRIGLTDGRQNTIYWADELSEGTLYFIALLCIINQPNPPKLLLLEEPEKGIHPRRIREVMDFIFRLAEEKDVQIILTTHNENVLNEFTSMPEAVFVFEKDEEGATHVKNLLHDIIEPSHKRSEETGTKEIDFVSNLGEKWMYGLLGGVPEETI